MQLSLKEKKLQEWVREFTSELLSWAFYKVSDSELAKDLVQDTFLAASEKFESFREDSSPKTWLFSILNYKIIDYYRGKIKQPKNYDKQSSLIEKGIEKLGRWKESELDLDLEAYEKSILEKLKGH